MILLLGMPKPAPSQTYLSLENPGKFKRIRLYPGDSIQIKVKGDPTWYRGHLNGFRGQKLLMFDDSLHVDSISHIGYPRKKLARHWLGMLRTNLGLAALLVPAMIIINVPFALMNLQHFLLVFGLPPASLGLARWLKNKRNKKFSLGKRWRLAIRYGPAEAGGRLEDL